MKAKRLIIYVAIAFVVLVVLGILRQGRDSSEPVSDAGITESLGIPGDYRSLYSELDEKIDDFNSSTQSEWDGSSYDNLVFGAELLTANGNLGEGLLTEQAFEGNVLLIQGFKKMGVGGVKISLNYPLLTEEFPRSDEYLEFYRKVLQELRKNDMRVLIQVSPIFADPAFSSLEVDYSGLTLESYQQGKRQQLEIIISELRPDYITVSQEPSTAAGNTGLAELNSVEGFVSTVEKVIEGLNPPETLIGAGVGTWEDTEFITELSQNPNIDFIDLHIYPLDSGFRNYLEQTVEMTDIAKSHGKKVVIGELWLSKASAKEISGGGGIASSIDRFKRDAFSFWEPLDSKFLETMMDLAHYKEFEFVSPFWTKYFFAYLDYSEENDALPYSRIAIESSRAAGQNIASGDFTQTGLAYKDLIER